MMFTFEKVTYVASINPKDGKQQFIAVDHHSGGYWYWSDYINGCKTFSDDDLKNLQAKLKSSHCLDEGRKIYVIDTKIKVIATGEIDQVEDQQRLKKIKELQAEIDKLEKEKNKLSS